MIIDDQYAKLKSQAMKLSSIIEKEILESEFSAPSEDSLNRLSKATNEFKTLVQATIRRFKKTGVFRYGLSEDTKKE